MISQSIFRILQIVFVPSLVILSCLDHGIHASETEAPKDRRLEMIASLPALAPHKSIAEQAKLFDLLVGTWNVEYSEIADDGKVKRSAGEVLFGWVLDGRVLQDIWITYPESGNSERSIGTTLRFYDAKAGTWRILWVDPIDGDIVELQGGPEGNRIVLTGKTYNGGLLRWSFNDIQNDSFIWRGEVSADNGKNWKLKQEYHMKRRMNKA